MLLLVEHPCAHLKKRVLCEDSCNLCVILLLLDVKQPYERLTGSLILW